jgi:hypothetical protein
MTKGRVALPSGLDAEGENCRSLHSASTASRNRSLRSELVTFLIWPVVCGWKARKSICQQSSPGFLRQAQDRLFDCAPYAVRYAIGPRGASLRMTPWWGMKNFRLATQKTREDLKKSQALGMTIHLEGFAIGCWWRELQIPRLRFASVPRHAGAGGMTRGGCRRKERAALTLPRHNSNLVRASARPLSRSCPCVRRSLPLGRGRFCRG